MEQERIAAYARELYTALRTCSVVTPLREREDRLSVAEAYRISRSLLELRLADGERLAGKKIGVTSKVVQDMLGVHQPDFGYLTDAMISDGGRALPISELLIQPRAEGEVAFVLKDRLCGPGVTAAEVLAATEGVMACIEIVDSRIENWNIAIEDTVADNASCGLLVLGDRLTPASAVDLVTLGVVLEKNGEVVATGAGAAAMGSPVNAVAWLANTLGDFGVALEAGEIILSGSLTPLVPVAAGDNILLRTGGIGSAAARFS